PGRGHVSKNVPAQRRRNRVRQKPNASARSDLLRSRVKKFLFLAERRDVQLEIARRVFQCEFLDRRLRHRSCAHLDLVKTDGRGRWRCCHHLHRRQANRASVLRAPEFERALRHRSRSENRAPSSGKGESRGPSLIYNEWSERV